MDEPTRDPRVVLCFGDSNTWGYDPATRARYRRSVRWPGVLQHQLGEAWHVVEAGLNGRTTVFDDPLGDKCGRRHLMPVLESAAPVDVVIVALGTNDLKRRFGVSAFEIAEGAGVLVDLVRSSRHGPSGSPPQVVLVAPPPIAATDGWEARDPATFEGFSTMWREAEETSRSFARQYARVARLRGVPMLDAGAHVVSSEIDGIHWSKDGHGALGRAVAHEIEALFARIDTEVRAP